MSSQKKPDITLGFLAGTETMLNKVLENATTNLNASTPYGITFHGLCEQLKDKKGNIFPALFQSNSKDYMNALANDQWIGYGFWDLDDPEVWDFPDEGSGNKYGHITYKVALIVYGNLSKLTHVEDVAYVDYRYAKQYVKDEIIKILNREMLGVGGNVMITQIYQQQIEEVFKGFTITNDQYNFRPYFGLRFECEITVTEPCN